MAAALDSALVRFITECRYVTGAHDLVTKWRIDLAGGFALDLYFNETFGKYSYTLIQVDHRVLGWDNAPHHRDISTFPHHIHQLDGLIGPSTLTGDPEYDLEQVRLAVEAFLEEEGLKT